MRYEFEDNAIFLHKEKANAQTIGEELEKITLKNGGRLTPAAVVGEAQKRGNPLHKHFEWNDSAAAQAYRLDQARTIIRSVKIVALNDIRETTARAYHSIQDNGRAYRSVTEIQMSAGLQLGLYKAALRDLIAWETRYRTIGDICLMVKVVREKLESEIASMQPDDKESRPHVGR